MTRTAMTPRTLADRLQDAATGPTTGEPTTSGQASAYADGKAARAMRRPRPDLHRAGGIYGDDAAWFIAGWDDADQAAPARRWRRKH